MNRATKEAGSYLVASAGAFLLDLSILAVQVSVFHVPYLAAAAVSFAIGTIFLYWASINHVFGYRRLANARVEFASFAIVGVVGMCVNVSAMYALVEGLGLHYLFAKAGAACITFWFNFGLRRLLLFSRRHRRWSGTHPGS